MQKEWLPIFAQYHLSENTLSRLAQSIVAVNVSAGKFLQLEAEECRGMYWVLTGEVIIFRIAPDGRELILQRLNRGGMINLVSVFEDSSLTHAAVRAERDSQCLWMPIDAIPRLLKECPDLAEAFLRMFAQRLRKVNALVEQIGLHSVRGRLAQFLIDLADGKIPPRQYTQDEMAAQIGTVRDMVGRTLRKFEDAGLIRRDRNQLLLRDRAGLEQEANK